MREELPAGPDLPLTGVAGLTICDQPVPFIRLGEREHPRFVESTRFNEVLLKLYLDLPSGIHHANQL